MVHRVRCPHEMLRGKEHHPTDRALVGCLLFYCYGRCRNSVLQEIHTLESDYSGSGALDTLQDAECAHQNPID